VITDNAQTAEDAHYDPLTGLPDRVLFYDRLVQAIAFAQRSRKTAAVLFIALDNVKLINDTLGDSFGDFLLKSIAQTIRNCIRGSDTVARPGRDEFMLLLPEIAYAEDAAILARRIFRNLESPFSIKNHELFITASIGISIFPVDGTHATTLIKNAYTALQRARDAGNNTFMFYSNEMNQRAFNRMIMTSNLRMAIRRDEFMLHYQPQINLRTGMISGMEALARWNRPGFGIIYPPDFIHLMEEVGLIADLGEWTLREACAQNKRWQDAGLRPVRISVNISARQLNRQDISQSVSRVLEETKLDPTYLELEVTESVLMRDAQTTIDALLRVRELGVHLSLDDFGTGYSSLSYLKYFPISRLKIVAPFISAEVVTASEEAIAKAIVAMAHGLNVEVIAEGVEKMEDLEFIKSLRCDEVQGHIFSRAVSAEEMTEFLAREKHFTPIH
jgi:diguanylate cyclase (GGDEF)-like protein